MKDSKSIDMKAKIRGIKISSWVGILGNAILAVLKIGVGVIFNSLAVLSDGIDTLSDVVTSFITLFAARQMNKPPDVNYPYGRGKIEALSTKVVSFFIFFAGVQIGIIAVKKLISGDISVVSPLVLIVLVISIFGKGLLALVKFYLGKKVESKMVIADAKNMLSDVILSCAILVGLTLSYFFKWYFLDSVFAIIVSLWIIYIAFTIFKDASVELMDGYSKKEDYNTIFDAVDSVDGAENPHKVRIRQIGSVLVIELDIEVRGSKTILEGHNIAMAVEEEIKSKLENVYDVLVHIEPSGNRERGEKFGIDKNSLQKDS